MRSNQRRPAARACAGTSQLQAGDLRQAANLVGADSILFAGLR